MAGIYIHIPFCKKACNYCDFHFSTSLKFQDEMLLAICKEIESRKEYMSSETIETIYFGGGTPSLPESKFIDQIVNVIHKNFHVHSSAEITLEANPDDLTIEKLKDFKNTGINRLSIGIQSFDDTILKYLNRIHDGQQAKKCIDFAQALGYDNISVDLIYGIPETDSNYWNKTLEQINELQIQHLSAYCLTIETKTVFGNKVTKGKMNIPDEEIGYSNLNTLLDFCSNNNFEQYEISNFCKEGFHSKHNSSYWFQKNYLGIGPGAHSYNGTERRINISNNPKYIEALKTNNNYYEIEVLTKLDKINEYILTSLRTKWGIDTNHLKEKYNYDILRNKKISKFVKDNTLILNNNTIKLTKTGIMIADFVILELFEDYGYKYE
ncbi:MAG: radical SAM family heme chaperone HemW [Cytophagales bacterium]